MVQLGFSQNKNVDVDSLSKRVVARIDSLDIDFVQLEYRIKLSEGGRAARIEYLGSNCDTCDLKAMERLSQDGKKTIKESLRFAPPVIREDMLEQADEEGYIPYTMEFSIDVYQEKK